MAQGVCLSLCLSLALTTGLVISRLRTQKRETLSTGPLSKLAHVIRRRKPYRLQMRTLPEYGLIRTRGAGPEWQSSHYYSHLEEKQVVFHSGSVFMQRRYVNRVNTPKM